MGKEWRGGDIAHYPGGGFKINLIKPVIQKMANRKNLVIMFVDRYSTLPLEENQYIQAAVAIFTSLLFLLLFIVATTLCLQQAKMRY